MNVTRQEVESAIGQKLDQSIPIEEISSLPTPNDQSIKGYAIKFVGLIKDKYKILAETWLGTIVRIYLLALTFGFPIPNPYEITVLAADQFQKVAPLVFNYLDSHASDAVGYLVSLPPEYTQQQFDYQITWDTLPTGSGVYPLSADIQMRI